MLLAPGNLPAVSERRRVAILVYTTHDDWARIDAHPTTALLRRYAEVRPIFFVLDSTISKHITMSDGHRIMLEIAAACGVLAVPIFADTVLADGDLSRLVALATGAPRRMVMVMGWRIAHEHLVERLPKGSSVISLPPREVVRLALTLRHSQMRCWSATRPGYGDDILGGPQWDVGDVGVVSHSIYWEPALVDFSHPWQHDGSPITQWTIDGHYPWANLGEPDTYYAVTDSDEFFHATTARETGPLAYHFDYAPMRGTIVEEMRRARGFRATDPLRQRLYDLAFLIHAEDFDPVLWDSIVAEARRCVEASAVPIPDTYSLVEHMPPVLLCSVGTTNLVRYDGHVYALPQSLGPVEVDCPEQRDRLFVNGGSVYDTEAEARAAVGHL